MSTGMTLLGGFEPPRRATCGAPHTILPPRPSRIGRLAGRNVTPVRVSCPRRPRLESEFPDTRSNDGYTVFRRGITSRLSCARLPCIWPIRALNTEPYGSVFERPPRCLVRRALGRHPCFGRYLEVTPHSRLVWTNDDGGAVTTVTFEEKGGKTLLVLHELHPSKEALDRAIGFGEGLRETFEQLDELLVTLGASAGRS